MTRHRKFSRCRAMALAGTLALLCNAKAFPVDVTSGDWPEVNHDKLPLCQGSCRLWVLLSISPVGESSQHEPAVFHSF